MKDILRELKVWDYVTGVRVRPADPTTLEAWIENDLKALTAIRTRVSTIMVTHIGLADTAKDAWDALANVFNTQGTMSRVTLRRRLFRYSIEEGSDIRAELRSIEDLFQQLTLSSAIASTGNLTDNDLAMIMLTALPSSWDAFVSSITGLDTLSSSNLSGRILQEDSRRKDRATSDTVLVATQRKKTKFRAGVFCHNCGKEGHIRPECRSDSKKDSGKKSSYTSKGKTRSHVAEQSDSDSSSESEYAFHVTDTESFLSSEVIWIGDTGTQSHIVRDRSLFVTYVDRPGTIHGAGQCASLGRGDVRINFATKSGTIPIVLKDAVHAPDMKYNLISLGRLTSAGLSYEGKGNSLHIKNGKKIIGIGKKTGNLYRLAIKAADPIALAARIGRTWYEWHCALGHLNKSQLQLMARSKMVNGMDLDADTFQDFECDACVQAKHSRRSFPKAAAASYDAVGDIIFSDIWGPARTTSLQGNSYMITFTDGYSRWVWTYYIKTRDAALACFKLVEAFLDTQFKIKIKALRVDNAREYTQGQFKHYLDSRGILLQATAPYSPQQNGVSERLNRVLIEHARAMLIEHNAPKFLWQEAAAYAVYLKNRSPTRALPNQTPLQALWGKKPDIQDVQEFGVPCWVLSLPREKASKLEAKSH